MSKKAKRIIIVISIIVLVMVIACSLFMLNIYQTTDNITISNVDLNAISDGTYIGEYQVLPVSVKVEVTIKNHNIEKVKILEHMNGLGSKAEVITTEVVGKQSLDVDIVAGATVSSKVILKAVENALTK